MEDFSLVMQINRSQGSCVTDGPRMGVRGRSQGVREDVCRSPHHLLNLSAQRIQI